MNEKEIKKKLKKIVSETYSWVHDPKGSDDFDYDLDIDYDELGELKAPIIEEFGVSIKKKEIKACDDINDLTSLIFRKISTGQTELSLSTTNSSQSGNLYDDLNKLSDELYTQEDVKGGLKIIMQIVQEVGGMVGLAIVVGKLLSFVSAGILAPIGLSIAGSQIARFQLMAVKAYVESNANERKKIRAVVTWIKGGFSLGDRLL